MDGKNIPQAFWREDGLRWSGADQPPVFHDDHFVGILPGLVHIVENDDDGLLPVLVDAAQEVEDAQLMMHVEVRRRFVQQEDGCILGQQDGQPGPLLFPAGQVLHGLAGMGFEADGPDSPFDSVPVFREPLQRRR